MRIVFWLDPKVGFDWSTPEVLSNIADGLVQLGYEVEMLIENQILDDYRVKEATKRAWFAEGNQQILADVLISNRLDYLLRNDYHRVGERIWLALEEDLTAALNQFENYQLYDEIRVCTLYKKVKEGLEKAKIETTLITPGIDLERLKTGKEQERSMPGIVVGLFDSRPEVARSILKGVEMTQSTLPQLDIHILTDQEVEFNTSLSVRKRVNPSLEDRIQAYEKSDILIYVPGQERTALLPLEAMSKNVPVIMSKHISVQEYARHEKNCLLLERLTPRAVALSILNIVKMGQIREELKSNGLQSSQGYDLQLSILNFEKLWNRTTRMSMDSTYEPLSDPDGERLDLVVVNRNSGSGIEEAITAIRNHTPEPNRLIVVDNGSKDDSIDYLKQEEGISLIVNQQNTGFAKACNQGILAGKGEYIVLLHSDLRVTEGWLELLLKEIRKPDVGLVTPNLLLPEQSVNLKTDTELLVSGSEADRDEEGLNPEEMTVDEESLESVEERSETEIALKAPSKKQATLNPNSLFFEGGCIVIKRQLLNQIGLLDERYFLYNETADYALRVMEKGYQAIRSFNSNVIHDSQSKTNEADREIWDKASAQSKSYFKKKWGDRLKAVPNRKVDGILLFGLYPWQRRTHRTEAMIDYFTRQGQKVVYVEPYCSVSVAEDLGQGQYLYVFQGSGTIYNNLSNPGRQVEMMQGLKQQLTEWGVPSPLLWLEAPWWEPLVKQIEHRMLVYTTPESFLSEGLENYQQLKEKFHKEEIALLESADLILTSSQKNQQDLSATYCEKVIYSPGGFYPTDLDRFLEGNYTMPDELTRLSGYKVGIVGNFNRYTPKKLITNLVKKHPAVSFVFVGDITCNLDELREISNLYFLGNKTWDHLLDCVYFFDLMLYPYMDKGLNSYLDPYLVNYYLAMGKPVVAFAHPELERFGPVVKQATDEDDFIQFVTESIQQLGEEKDAEKIRERIHQIRGFSWEERFDRLYDLIDSKVPMAYTAKRSVEKPEVLKDQKETKEVFITGFWKQIQEGYKRLRSGFMKDRR